jgi:pimeloyl-ACP methyl ester carboxylesterase
MDKLLRSLLYFGLGSVAAGTVFGIGFSINLGRRMRSSEMERVHRLGWSKPVTLQTVEGVFVQHGDRPRPTIVFVHGRSANPMEVFPIAEAMFREGFNAVLWQHRGRAISYGQRAIEEILGIVQEVRRDPFVDRDRIFLLGLSLGAAIVIGAAAQDHERHIAAIIADSSYANLKRVAFRYLTAFGWIPSMIAWPTAWVAFQVAQLVHGVQFATSNPSEWARHVKCPVLLIHGRYDWRIPPHHALEIDSQLPGDKQLWLADGVGHTGAFARRPHEYTRRLTEFFAKIDGHSVTE